MNRRRNRVRVWKHPTGLFVWDCGVESCKATDTARHGASFYWEIAQHMADTHVREWHRPEKHLSHDMPTPPGVPRFDWSDTGQHVRIQES